jgi:uncharacterized protein (TIGR02996 family)
VESLTKAARALSTGDYDTGLALLLAAWDETHARELADAIERVSARVTSQLPRVEGRTQREALAAWVDLARQKRPSDVGRLLAALVDVMAAGPPHMAQPRLEEMLLWPPDPRVTAALLDALAGPIGSWTDRTYVRAVKALVRHGDAGWQERLDAALDIRAQVHHGPIRARFARVESTWEKRVPGKAPPGVDEISTALATAPSPVTPKSDAALDGAALLAAIYQDPADETQRLVYADHLSGLGDPRGELIVLQLDRAHGGGSPAKAAREKALLKAHGKEWLGGLAAEIVMVQTRWEGGFPAATVTKMYRLSQVEASVRRPEWATLRRIRFEGVALLSETMAGLEEVLGLTEAAARRMAELKTPPPRLHTVALTLEDKALSVDEPAVAAVLAVATLRRLTLYLDGPTKPTKQDVKRFRAALGDRLDSLTLSGLPGATTWPRGAP